MQISKILIYSVATSCLASACFRFKGTKSQIHHTPNEPTRSLNSLDFAGGGNDIFDKLVAPRLGTKDHKAIFLPEGDPLTRRAQFWMDQIDLALRSHYKGQFSHIPKPIARIWISASPNGFTVPISVCGLVPVRFGDGIQKLPDDKIASISFSGELFPMPNNRCREHGAVSPQDMAEWFNRNVGSCGMSASSDNKELVISECKLASTVQQPQSSQDGIRASGFGFFSTSQVVTLTSGLFLTLKTEAQLVAVIAHELAHYYRSHPSMSTAKFNFFYKLENYNPPQKPTPSPELIELGIKAIQSSRGARKPGERFVVTDPAARIILAQAATEKLGYYTYEQEADELALEWLALVGIAPQVLIEKLFALLEYNAQSITDSDLEYGYVRCRALFEKNWKNSEGSEVFVPIGDFSNPHHSLCYRAFNASRELTAHRFSVAEPTQRFLGEKQWQELKNSASQLLTANSLNRNNDFASLPEEAIP